MERTNKRRCGAPAAKQTQRQTRLWRSTFNARNCSSSFACAQMHLIYLRRTARLFIIELYTHSTAHRNHRQRRGRKRFNKQRSTCAHELGRMLKTKVTCVCALPCERNRRRRRCEKGNAALIPTTTTFRGGGREEHTCGDSRCHRPLLGCSRPVSGVDE